MKQMSKPYYYKNLTSGRTVFVLLEKGKNGDYWTIEPMSVKASSIDDLKPFSKLKGSKVKLGDCEGIVIGCYPHHHPLEGKYYGDGKYLTHKQLLNMNHLVRVYWTKGLAQVWQPFFKLKLI
jgi:hypothetical protein